MNCNNIEPLLIDYLEESLNEDNTEMVSNHLSSCKNCSQKLEEFECVLRTISCSELKIPSKRLNNNFYEMLKSELSLKSTSNLKLENTIRNSVINFSWIKNGIKIAASFIILGIGIWIGTRFQIQKSASQPEQFTDLRKDVKEMKEVLMFSLLNAESASQRIKAVSYAEDISNPDTKVINALSNTMNHDKNVNVRLASIYALASYPQSREAIDSLIVSLGRQKEPIIQVMIINLLAEKKVARTNALIRNIIRNKNTEKEVKDAARKSLMSL